jgi:hypothetical protein
MTPDTLLTFDGVEQPIAEHALDYGIPASRIIMRLVAGWSIENAITRPVSIATGMKARKASPSPRQFNPLYAHDGETLTLTQWADRVGVSRGALVDRLSKGMTLADAITTPVRHGGKRSERLVTHQDVTLNVKQWAERLGVSSPCISRHLKAHGNLDRVGTRRWQ